jgi:hypothetical protein
MKDAGKTITAPPIGGRLAPPNGGKVAPAPARPGPAQRTSPNAPAARHSGASFADIAALDFNLTSISSSGPGSYTAAGPITATSDPYWTSKMLATTTV